MQDTVIPCPHCHGTGEIRGAWWVVTRWQDGQDYHGPFESREAAEREATRRGHPSGNPWAEVIFRQEA